MMEGMDKKRILMVSANPWDTDRIRLDQEHDVIQEVMEHSQGQERYDIKVLTAARGSRFQDLLLDFKPHIIHYSGHGEEDQLAFDSGGEKAHWISNEILIELFKSAAPVLECVVLNSCRTETLANSVSEHIDFVIGMSQNINDQTAIQFARGFYKALFTGHPYTKAFQQALIGVELAGLPGHLTPRLKIRENARRFSFAPGCEPDILILCPESQKEWTRMVRAELDDLLSLRLGSRNTFTLALATDADETLPEAARKAGLLLPVISARFEGSTVCKAALDAFMAAADSGGLDRIFPLQTEGASLPEALRSVLPHPFWRTGGETVAAGDAWFNATLEMLVREITGRLHRLKDEIEYRRKIEAKHEKASQPLEKLDFPPAILFVNSAPEDEDLREEITGILKENGVEYLEPMDMADNPTPEEIRRALELNIEICHLHVLIHGRSRLPWVQEQFLYSQKVWRQLKQNLKIVVIHKEIKRGAKGEIKGNLRNARIYACPPEKFPDYLFGCMGEVCHE